MYVRTIVLKPWHLRVAGGYAHVAVTLEREDIDVRKVRSVEPIEATGWFAIYEDRVFGIFLTLDGENTQASLLVNGKVWQITNETRLAHRTSLTHRTFEYQRRSDFFAFDYQRLWPTLLRRPIYALREVLLADDWWGVVCDLPGTVVGGWDEKSLVDVLKRNFAHAEVSKGSV